MKDTIRVITLLAVILSGPLIVYWALSKEESLYYWVILVTPVLWIGLLLFWYLVLGWGKWHRRLLRTVLTVAVFVVLGVAFGYLFRYEGSLSGTSLPKFVPRWQSVEGVPAEPTRGAAIADANPPGEELLSAARDLTQFFGPDRNAILPGETVSFDWETTPPKEIWRRPMGAGWSSFSVAGRRVYTQEQLGEDECVTCYDLVTGQRVWKHADEGVRFLAVMTELRGAGARMSGEGPRATPTIHGDRVYTLGSTGIVNCIDRETGENVWKSNVLEDFDGAIPEWGKSTSPLVLEEAGIVIVSGAQEPGSTLTAYDLETGDVEWNYVGNGASYSSPRLMTLHGVEQVVSVNAKDVSGVEPATGKELWRISWPGSFPKVAQPMDAGEGRLLVTASYGMGSLLIEVTRDGNAWGAEQIWRSLRLKTKFSSASVREGFAYLLDEGRLACVEIETGERIWKSERYGFGQQLLVGDHLLIQSEPGAVAIGRASPEEFVESGRIEALDSMTWNAPALAGRILLVRNDREAVCYLLPGKP